MIKSRNGTGPLCFSSLLFFVLLPSGSTRPQTAPTPTEYMARDVVMVSLEALGPRAEDRRKLGEGLTGESGGGKGGGKYLLEIQMDIVRETAKFGPVLLLVPDEATKSAVYQRCKEFEICELLRNDRVRMKVVTHDGVWIRDFGPQIEITGDSAYVVHWRYFDVRAEQAKQEKFQELEAARLKLLETREQEDQPDVLTQESTREARKAVVSTIDDKLYLLREYSQILSEADIQRPKDENSAYDIADAVLAAPDFNYKSSGVALDGGNLLKLEDGRCLTTRVLRSRNRDQQVNLDQELENTGGCKSITYLEPLPGPVIEHVDMFALPVGGKRILLASFDLSKRFAAEYWSKLSNSERDLAVEAELAMESDAERLRRLGYEVVPVPSPFARIPANGHTYFPSVLNALVRVGTNGYRQVLVPSYKDYETDIQISALNQIRAAFGVKTEIVTIEATEAAKAQGAVHCLTLTAPLQVSIFSDSADAGRRSEALARKDQLDRTVTVEIAGQIPATGLQGSWVILGEDETDQTPLELYPQKIFFGEHEFQKGVFDKLESQGTYTIDTRNLSSWSLHFRFSDQDIVAAALEWLSKDKIKLVFEDGDRILVLRRIGSDPISPFQSLQGTGVAGGDHLRRKKPTTSGGQASDGGHLAQP